jgi:hypothetical protein
MGQTNRQRGHVVRIYILLGLVAALSGCGNGVPIIPFI